MAFLTACPRCGWLLTSLLLMTCMTVTSCELLQNGGFESGRNHWDCWGLQCHVITDSHQGVKALGAYNRTALWAGPSQAITTKPGQLYRAASWIKLLNDKPGKLGQMVELEASFTFPGGKHIYLNVAVQPLVAAADGWFLLQGDFQAPPQAALEAKFYYQGPEPGIDFAVDQATVSEIHDPDAEDWRQETARSIEKLRAGNIRVTANVSQALAKSTINIQLLQTKKSFPFGTTVSSWVYTDPAQSKYRDFVHSHFNWAVPGNMLKWRQFDWNHQQEGPNDKLYARAQNTIDGLRNAGLKVRGHNLVWSVGQFIPESVKRLTGQALRDRVKQHVTWTVNVTKGLLEHWDVNNENLHGQWFQEALHDRNYDLELFRMSRAADPNVKLFLNDYNVVAQGAATSAYLNQAQRFKAADVGLYGIGVQCHFHTDQEPSPAQIKRNLDVLAKVGVSIWVTELDVASADQEKRADYLEKALTALYAHPAVEGIMLWSWEGKTAADPHALAVGGDMTLTSAGRRLLDLLESRWMTDKTVTLSPDRPAFTVRGFHGSYELRVFVDGQLRTDLTNIFTTNPAAQDLSINVNIH